MALSLRGLARNLFFPLLEGEAAVLIYLIIWSNSKFSLQPPPLRLRPWLTYNTIVVITTKCLVNISIHYQTSQARIQESASLEMELNTALFSLHAPVVTKFREEIRELKDKLRIHKTDNTITNLSRNRTIFAFIAILNYYSNWNSLITSMKSYFLFRPN